MKKINYKKILTEIDSNAHVSHIEDIVDNLKNCTLKISIDNKKIFELSETIIAIMDVSDETGTISAIIINSKNSYTEYIIDSIIINNKYFVVGSVSTDIEQFKLMFNDLIGNNNFIFNNDKILIINAIQNANI